MLTIYNVFGTISLDDELPEEVHRRCLDIQAYSHHLESILLYKSFFYKKIC